ncbi:Crp/Fnr family transcriptional regulator [Micromonospora sp. CPCC 206061]|uniref:Crp/Fnr family transcriptional regulator n=1 Tax=Micromonospora sp. CPCC 206061 TaxID=3122410 RepID=UPI002FF2A899
MKEPASRAPSAAFSPEEIAALQALGIPVTMQPGNVLFAEGERTDHAVLLNRGRVKITSTGSNGQEVVLAVRGPGEIVGEMAPLDRRPRSATVVAITPVEVSIVRADDFNNFLNEHPRVMRSLLTQVIRRLRDADHRRVELATTSVMARVASRLLELASVDSEDEDHSGLSPVPAMSQSDLASLVGASREAVSKVLRTLRSSGIISTHYRSIEIKDLDALRGLARESE